MRNEIALHRIMCEVTLDCWMGKEPEECADRVGGKSATCYGSVT